jgi:iron complex outermembrane receptor protein
MKSRNISRRRGPRALMPVLLATTALAAVPGAQAETGIETVVVTAEKRVEDLQKVPFAITALSQEKLSQLEVHNFNDYVKFLPSVNYTVGQPSGGGNGAPGFATVTFRGVSSGSDGNHSGSQPTVGVYLDEEPITTIGGTLDVPAYDVQRIEALAGPQGTLYGASSEAGTIRIITNKPDSSAFSAGYDVEGNSVAHGGLGGVAEGFANIPLADNMAIRIVAWDEHDAGYIDNVHGTRFFPTSGVTLDNSNNEGRNFVKNDYNTVDKYGARAALKIDLDANWTATVALMGQDENSNGFFAFDGGTYFAFPQFTFPGGAPRPAPPFVPSAGDLQVQHFFPEFVHDYWYQAGLTIQGKIGNFDITYAGSKLDRWIHEASDYTDYGFWYDNLYPPSYFGCYFYNNSATTFCSGNPATDGTIPPAQHIDARDYFTKDSQELRIASPSDDRLRFLAGLFYERQGHWILQDYIVDNLADFLSVEGWPHTIWLTDQERQDHDYAVFGEVNYDILPNLTATGGIRVYHYDNSLKGFFGFNENFSSHTGVSQCPGGVAGPPTLKGGPCINLDKDVTGTGETHKASIKYQIDDDHMVYATYSTGFRPGGANRRSTVPPGNTPVPPYQADGLTNYEIGWKTSWLDSTVIFNGDVFWERWGRPQFSFLSVNSFTIIQNATPATIKGVEGNFIYAPDNHFTLTGAGAYTDGHLNQDFCGFNNVITGCPNAADPFLPFAPKGTQLPGTSRYKGNMTARYEFDVYGMTAHLQAAVEYQSSQWSDLRTRAADPLMFNPPLGDPIRALLGHQHGFTQLDLATGLRSDVWSLEFFVKNVTDTRGDLYRFSECATQVCGHEHYQVPIEPRLIGIRFGQRFD